MLYPMLLISYWSNLIAMLDSSTEQAIVAVIFVLISCYTQYHDSLQLIPEWVEHEWYLFKSNHKLHMQLAAKASHLIVFVGSFALITMVIIGVVPVWITMPFSVPLFVSLMVAVLIAFIPGLVGAPMLIYIKCFPPDKWV